MSEKISVTLEILESHRHIARAIEQGTKLYKQGAATFAKDAPLGYIADIPENSEHRRVMVNFTQDGWDIESYYCNKCALRSAGSLCRHVVAGVLAVQGGITKWPFGAKALSVRDNPQFLNMAIEYLSAKWPVPKVVYQNCIEHSMNTESPLPRWYLLVNQQGETIGCYGLIANDFNSRQDLWPWLCALYVEEECRGHALGARMLLHARREAKRLGFGKLYLSTDHLGYYEKYGWQYIADAYDTGGEAGRVYEIVL